MGQRLILEIIKDEKALASAYYHWSGYTEPAIEMIRQMITALEKNPAMLSDTFNTLDAVRLLEVTDARMDAQEIEDLSKQYPNEIFASSVSRNSGIINQTAKGMSNNMDWGEAFGSIDISNKTVTVDTFFEEEDTDEVMEQYDLTIDELNALPSVELNYSDITFEQFATLEQEVHKLLQSGFSMAIQPDGAIVSMIE